MNSENNYVWSYKGNALFPKTPTVHDFDVVEMANATSKDCRFGGQIHEFYSVAEHSVIMSFLTENPLEGLFHDCLGEYLMRDMPKPTKLMLPDYNEMEHILQVVGCKKYNINVIDDADIHTMDQRIVVNEANLLFPVKPDWLEYWPYSEVHGGTSLIKCWDHETARAMFLRRYVDITGDHESIKFPHGVEFFYPKSSIDWSEYEEVRRINRC